ncbi:hypothetical protein [Streptomyces sp. JB150]|uniref:DUF7144 family membrane protein n=1 Tax=Streptomyces sp. JB150 TaxID=2714844 RepID=UPI00140D2331|nr:hypothetical protein [Streptomyces sp. JB150]QIJ65579.1 hypothetical protein G7Z13_28780 [Streptomyces sp. JB150]
MSEQPHRPRRAAPPQGEIGTAWTAERRRGTTDAPAPPSGRHPGQGAGTLAGVLMLCGGVMAVLQGIAAVAEDDVYARIGGYVYEVRLTGWGWIHVVVGALVAVAGWGVLTGASRARPAGLALVTLSLVAQFLFLPYAPLWALVMVAIDVFVLGALTARTPAAPPSAASATPPRR